ncbi:MAG: MFS transporter [Steroidobacteraceae bacterium]
MQDTSEFRRDRAWQIVLAATVGCAFGLTALPFYTLGMVAKPLAAEFGWGRAVAQSGIVFSALGVLSSAWLVGALIDRYGPRRVALFSQFGLALGFVGFAIQSGTPTWWYANWFVLAVFGVGTTPITWSRGVAAWFERQRGLALGLGLMGTGVTAFAAPPLMGAAIATYGWRWGYAGIAIAIVLIALPTTYFLFRERASVDDATGKAGPASRPESLEATGVTLGEAVRGYRFWVLVVVFFFTAGVPSGLIPNVVPMLTDGGMTVTQAAGYASLIGVFVIAGRLLAGWLLDRLWAPIVGAIVMMPTAIACWLLEAQTMPALAAAFIGLAGGAEFDLMAYILVKYFGMRHYGKIYAWQWASFTIAAGVGPLLLGRIYDATGTYAAALAAAAIAMLIAPLLLFTLGPYTQRAGHGASH